MVFVWLVNNAMHAVVANRNLKVVAGKTIAGPGQMERGKPGARIHHHGGCRVGLRCMEAGWVLALRVHCRASRTGRMEVVQLEEDDPVGLRAIPDRSPNQEVIQEACDAVTQLRRP